MTNHDAQIEQATFTNARDQISALSGMGRPDLLVQLVQDIAQLVPRDYQPSAGQLAQPRRQLRDRR